MRPKKPTYGSRSDLARERAKVSHPDTTTLKGHMRLFSWVNRDFSSNNDRQDVFTTVTSPIKSNSKVRRPILGKWLHKRWQREAAIEAKSNDDWQNHHYRREIRWKVWSSHINRTKLYRKRDPFLDSSTLKRKEEKNHIPQGKTWRITRIASYSQKRRQYLDFSYAHSIEVKIPLCIYNSWSHKWA